MKRRISDMNILYPDKMKLTTTYCTVHSRFMAFLFWLFSHSYSSLCATYEHIFTNDIFLMFTERCFYLAFAETSHRVISPS